MTVILTTETAVLSTNFKTLCDREQFFLNKITTTLFTQHFNVTKSRKFLMSRLSSASDMQSVNSSVVKHCSSRFMWLYSFQTVHYNLDMKRFNIPTTQFILAEKCTVSITVVLLASSCPPSKCWPFCGRFSARCSRSCDRGWAVSKVCSSPSYSEITAYWW